MIKDAKGNETIAFLKNDFETEIRIEKPFKPKCPKCSNGIMRKGRSAYGCSLFKKTCDFLIPFSLVPENTPNKLVEKFLREKLIQTSDRVIKLTDDFGIEIE